MPSPTCPPGTLCLDTTTAVALVVILALVAYIGYLRLGNTTPAPHPPTAEEDAGDDGGADRAPFPARAPRRRRRSTPATTAPPPTTTDDDDDPNDARIVAAATASPPNVTTNIFQSTTYEDPMLRPPLRRYVSTYNVPVAAVPINIQTRGPTPEVQQVGVLTSADNDKILALYGRPTYRGSSKWLYYTGTDKYQSLKLPVERAGRNCTDEFGCDELTEDDAVSVKGYGGTFKASIYNLDAPRYIPFVG